MNKYCSKVCRRNHQSILQKRGYNKICKHCNKLFYTKRCNNYNFCSIKCANKYRIGLFNSKGSITRSKLIAEGKINPKRNYYKQGYYISTITNRREWFGSSYEEKRMKQLDILGIPWTKKHGIRIAYIDNKGNTRHYVPDFLISTNIIEEVKPSNLVNSIIDNNKLKYDAAVEFCNKHNYQYRIITEKDLK